MHDPTITLLDTRIIREAILQALSAGAFEDVVDIYRAHLRVLNRTRTAKALNVSRQSIHKMLKPTGNPSLKTLAAFMKYLSDDIAKKEARAPARN